MAMAPLDWSLNHCREVTFLGKRKLNRWVVLGVIVAIAIALLFPIPNAWATPDALASLQPLTAERLQDRLQSLVNRDGTPTVDLRRFVIDLRPENADFRDRFYRQLQAKLQGGATAVGLDLSYAQVQGDLDFTRLALQASLYDEGLSNLLSETAQTQLNRDRRRVSQLSQLSRSLLIQPQPARLNLYVFRGPLKLVQTQFQGTVDGSDVFFLNRVEAQGAVFGRAATWAEARFSDTVSFIGALFQADVRFRNAIFFDRVRFNQGQFRASSVFQGAEFRTTANFNQAEFSGEANFNRVQWQGNADFAQTTWQGQSTFVKDSFQKALFLTETRFDAPLILREARFSEPINLRGASVLSQIDFGDVQFLPGTYANVSGMEFNAEQGEILGSPGRIGQRLSVPTLSGNETLLRNLVRNFRRLEQVADANHLEYTTEKLRLNELQKRLLGVNLNGASVPDLLQVGFSQPQVDAIVQQRQTQPFLTLTDLLTLDAVDLAAYVKVRDRVVTGDPLAWVTRLQTASRWFCLELLLVLSHYGTSVGLTFGIGLLAIAWFALLFWLVDRYRRRLPTPLVPRIGETLTMVGSFVLITLISVSIVVRTADYPGLTLGCLAVVTLPVPGVLTGVLYQQGRYHDLLETSYFVEDGSMRQLRLLIARLPNIPKFPFYRDRYTPILLDRRWNWLNYYDFSFINWFKFGFNDIRIRDQHMPGLITALVWYQWCLGILYIVLLLWTLSRTIPGLNLLLYF
ncbi:MAG: pentapeptide repeat-containing protein [Cyanobacteria bacterium J06639_16]